MVEKNIVSKEELVEKKRQFIEKMMEREFFVVFSGNGLMEYFGFKSNGDFLIFILEQIYAWEANNPVFRSILENLSNKTKDLQKKEELLVSKKEDENVLQFLIQKIKTLEDEVLKQRSV